MIAIKLSVQSKEKEIIELLMELKNILHSEGFNIDRDFTIIKSKKKSGKDIKRQQMEQLFHLAWQKKLGVFSKTEIGNT